MKCSAIATRELRFPQQHNVFLHGLIAGNDLVDPVNVGRNTCNCTLGAIHVAITDGTNERPLVMLVFAHERTPTVTLQSTRRQILQLQIIN